MALSYLLEMAQNYFSKLAQKYLTVTADLDLEIKSALMLCIGITEDELEFVFNHGDDRLVNNLKEKKVYPYTILDRESVLN